MKRILAAIFAILFMTPAAYAQENASVGFRLNQILQDLTSPLLFLISFSCAVGGLWLLAKALLKLKDSGGQSDQTSGAMVMLVAAVLLIALPEAAGVGMITMVGDQSGILNTTHLQKARAILDDTNPSQIDSAGGNRAFASPSNCYSEEKPVPCMAANLAQNVVPIGIVATFALAFIAGLWGFGHALFELAKAQGGRPLPEGWWSKLIFNVVLLNAPVLFQTVSQTILGQGGTVGGNGLVSGSSLLKYNLSSNDALEQYQTLIGHVFTILALFGAIAFVRGIFVCKAAGEGRQGGTYGHGFVFIIAGILLANSKYSTCLVLNTMLGADGTFGFCSA